jgi:uncharacterized protein (TIGR03437 family)
MMIGKALNGKLKSRVPELMQRTCIFLLLVLPLTAASATNPVLGLAEQFGDKGNNSIQGIATDSSGNLYIVGTTLTEVPLLNPINPKLSTANCSDEPARTFQQCETVFAAKFDSTGTKLIYSTYLGEARDVAAGIAVDRDGNAFVAGTSRLLSDSGPAGSSQFSSSGKAWVRKLNAAGSAVLYYRTIEGQTLAKGIAVDSNGNAYLAGTSTALDFPSVNALEPSPPFKPVLASSNGGATWNALSNLHVFTVYSMAVDPTHPSTLYAATSSGVFKSTDTGANWTQLLSDATSASQVALDPSAPSTIYLLYTDAKGASDLGKSTDGGATWQNLTTGIPQAKLPPFLHAFGALALDPSNPSVIWLSDVAQGGPAIYRSTDAGAHWTDVHDFPAFFISDSLGGSAPGLLVDPNNSSRVYACCVNRLTPSSGVFRTDDGGQTWVKGGQSPMAGSSGIWAPVIDRHGVLYASWYDGLVHSSDAGATWMGLTLPSGAPTTGYSPGSLAIDSSGALLLVNDNGILLRSTDGGSTWTSTPGPWQPGARILYASGSTVYVGSPYTGLTQHAFAAKLDSGGGILWATLLAGSSHDEARAIAMDASGNAYVAGRTDSKDFPLANAYQNVRGGAGGGYDAFLSKISSDGSKLLYSTYLGGSGDDVAQTVAVDGAGNAYVAGGTNWNDFPTINAIQPIPGNKSGGSFVSQFDTSGRLLFSTYLSGTRGDPFVDGAAAIALSGDGSVWVAGITGTLGFPLVNPIQPEIGAGYASYVAKLVPASKGFALDFSTYLGDGNDTITTLALASGVVWVGLTSGLQGLAGFGIGGVAYLVRIDLSPPTPKPGVPLIQTAYNAASYRPATTVAPGELVALMGAELAPATERAQLFPLPTSLQGVQVLVGETAVPLLFVSPDQINFQVPYDIPATGVSITVERAGQRSNVWSAVTVTAAPGIFTGTDGYTAPVVVHASDYTLVTPQHPAHQGEYLAVFCSGLGATNPPARAGDAATAARIQQNYYVTLDGLVVDVSPYAGLAPGWAGLYQINFQLRNDEPTGTRLLNLSVGPGMTSNRVQIYVE